MLLPANRHDLYNSQIMNAVTETAHENNIQAEAGERPSLPDLPVIYGAPEGAEARAIVDRVRAAAEEGRVHLHIAQDDARLYQLAELIAFFAPEAEIVTFPAWDCLPYDRVSPNGEVVAQRIAALTRILGWERERQQTPRIVLTTVNAATQRIMPRAALDNAALRLAKGASVDMDALKTRLARQGYNRVQTVREPGEYAVRGDIVDLYPSGLTNPVRIDMFGDQIERIREFDAVSQLTQGEMDALNMQPMAEFFLDEESVHRFRRNYREYFGVADVDDPLYAAISEGRRHAGMEHWLPCFYEEMATLADYLPNSDITLDQHALHAREERLDQVADFYQARRTLEDQAQARKNDKGGDVSLSGTTYHPLPPDALYLTREEMDDWLTEREAAQFSPFRAPDGQEAAQDLGAAKARDFADERAKHDADLFGALADYLSELRRETPGRPVIVAAGSAGARDRLWHLMENAGMAGLVAIDSAADVKKLKTGQTGMAVLTLDHGFIADDLAVVTEQDLLGDKIARRSRKKRRADNFLREVSALEPGDLVVHVDHGVGRFESLETVEAAGKKHDCLKLVYDGDDRLYVPVENIDVLSRFGADEGNVTLDKLGGTGWQARKAKVKKDLMRMADDLMQTAAARQVQHAPRLNIDEGLYQDFVARFPYQETEDQLRAIEDTLNDTSSGQPMDRLICGDVGFGKTEAALRAAYVAAKEGMQVAVIAPTTLLARQHYYNFLQRFEGTGLNIAQLSRFVTQTEASKTRQRLRDGSVNIVIGTHALLGKNIQFANLGLLVVDEEQRFGVKQKERLKALKTNVHVLTLTATPIPRTMQLAMSGVRDMSVIATPPVDRLAIRTFVLPYDPVVVREALLREHYRGGQSFYVCPRIQDIATLQERLAELVPELRVVTAHGQMASSELEDRVSAFYDGQYDILLSTNIIENGLDIPAANTMIVHRADMFGLSQLYQIRGRIGRAKVRAYAYMTYPPQRKLSKNAQKRLEVLETLDSLGAGFQLASHDLDIRGAGNLLGEEQSGHVKEVGIELYQQMLEDAVAAAKSGVDMSEAIEQGRWSPQINLGTNVLIPENYVADLSLRMSLYRRLGDLESESDIEDFAAELVDRFGQLPEEVDNLLDIVRIKIMCKTAGIDRVEAGPKGGTFGFHKDQPPNVQGLMHWMQDKGGAIKLRADHKIVATRDWGNLARRVRGVKGLVSELAELNV